MAELSRTLTLKVKGNVYTVKFPTVGQFIDIEARRAELTRGQYGQMYQSNLKASQSALDMVDVVSYFTTLCPQLLKDLNGLTSFLDIDAIDFKELVKAYREQFIPWLNEWYKLYEDVKEEVKKNEETSTPAQ